MVNTFEAVAGSGGPGSAESAPAVNRVMAGAQDRNKIAKNIREITFGGGFCKCHQTQIHWYDIS